LPCSLGSGEACPVALDLRWICEFQGVAHDACHGKIAAPPVFAKFPHRGSLLAVHGPVQSVILCKEMTSKSGTVAHHPVVVNRANCGT